MSDLDLLRDLADQITPPPLDSLRDTARGRDRRTAGVIAVSAAFAVTVLAGTALLLGTGDHKTAPAPVQPPTGWVSDGTRPLVWAEGPTVHIGSYAIRAAGPVVELAPTDDGVVYRTEDGRIWFTDGATSAELGDIGTPPPGYQSEVFSFDATGHVMSGNTGSLVAWIEFRDADTPELVVHHTGGAAEGWPSSTPREGAGAHAYPAEVFQQGQTPMLVSVFDDAVYWVNDPDSDFDRSPTMRLDLASGSLSPINPDQYQSELAGRESQRMFAKLDDEDPRVNDRLSGVYAPNWSVQGGRVQPLGEGPMDLRDAASNEPMGFSAPAGSPRLQAVWMSQWLDDDTIAMLWSRPGGDDLMSCDIGDACRVVVTRPSDSVVVPHSGSGG